MFGALAVVAIYLCGLSLFAAQGPAIAAAAIACCNQMLYVQARAAMLDIFALAFSGLASQRSCRAIGGSVRCCCLRSPGPALAWRPPANGAACFRSGRIGIIGLVRLLQRWQTSFADATTTTGTGPNCGRT